MSDKQWDYQFIIVEAGNLHGQNRDVGNLARQDYEIVSITPVPLVPDGKPEMVILMRAPYGG